MKFDADKNPLYVIGFAAVLSGVFTGAIMALHVATEPIVAANEKLLEEKALVDLFDLGDVETLSGERIAELYRNRIRRTTINPGTDEEMELLVAFDSDQPPDAGGDVLGRPGVKAYAFPIEGIGFWAMIRGYLAVTPDLTRATGVVFLQHSETPGLGGRITEKQWRDRFKGLPVTPPPAGMKYIYIQNDPPADPKKRERYVDAITGATGTSTAVGKFVNVDLARFRAAAKKAGLI